MTWLLMPEQQCGSETMIYFDYQSSRPVDSRVLKTMLPYFDKKFGNPSSLHEIGDEATLILEQSRSSVAEFINAEPGEIIFTSGATEANNLALIGYAFRNRGNHIIISEIEHISIHNIAKYLQKNGFVVTKVPVDFYGRINIDALKQRITDKTILISITYASNEVGTIQDIPEIAGLCREKEIAFHTDAVAAEPQIHIDVKNLGIDLMSLSSNDIYGPKGVGVLYIRKGIRLNPLILGGGQEFGLRSGTENIPGIVGMKIAAEIMSQEMDQEVATLKGYQQRLIKGVLENIPDSYLNGHPRARLANNVHFRFDGIEGESLLLGLKDKGISVSTGSACSSKTLEPSHTLIALGLLHEEAHGSLQLTMGRFNRAQDIDTLLNVLPDVVRKLRKLSPLYKGV